MIKITLYGLLLFVTNIAIAGPEKTHDDIDRLAQEEKALEKQADIDIKEWEAALFQYLSENESPNVRIFAFHTIIKSSKDLNSHLLEINQSKINQVNTFIANIMNDSQIGAQALKILSARCFNEQKSYDCNNNQLLEKLIALEPKNIASYVSLLNKAVEAKDSREISDVLSLMAKASFHNHHISIHPELEQAVIEFADKYPLPESYIKSSPDLFGFNDSNQNFSYEELEINVLLSLLIGIKMAIPTPSYQNFTRTCKNSERYEASCLKISDTLINNSYTILAKKIGYAIQEQIYKKSGDDNQSLRVKQANDRLSHSFTCLSKSIYLKDYSGMIYTKEKFQQSIQVERDHGELASFKKLAELNYQEHLINGDLDAINPDTCFK